MADQAWEQIGTHGIDRADGEHTTHWILALFRQQPQVLRFAQNRASLLNNKLSGGSGGYFVACAFE